MKKIFIYAMAVVGMLACKGQNEPSNPVANDGALPGKFSVSKSEQVQFSQGNLQYKASEKKWRFAEKQYDFIGESNSNISDTYDGWIDLFGWGTGNNPTCASDDNRNFNYDKFVDWGKNAISNGGNKSNQWRTLTTYEWSYLFNTRANAAFLFGLGKVNGVKGTIILPDDWETPSGITFKPSVMQGLQSSGDYYKDKNGEHYNDNVYTTSQWAILEQHGAVFLPSSGRRRGANTDQIGEIGYYWAATCVFGSSEGDALGFATDYLYPTAGYGRSYGNSVRLVR